MTMPTIFRAVLLTALLFIPFPSYAAQDIQPGKYVTEGGWGALKIVQGRDGTLYFEISSVGINAHTCTLSGDIRNGKAELEGEESKPCIVTFDAAKGGINVADKDGECSYYCGARGTFTALYLKPQPGCEAASIQQSRDDFKLLFDKKDYLHAQAKLEPVLDKCSNIIHWSDLGLIRNDIAINRHNLGDDAGCRQILEPLVKDAEQTDDALQKIYPPADAELILPIAAATRANLKLCTPATK